jgi:hypothetical protein
VDDAPSNGSDPSGHCFPFCVGAAAAAIGGAVAAVGAATFFTGVAITAGIIAGALIVGFAAYLLSEDVIAPGIQVIVAATKRASLEASWIPLTGMGCGPVDNMLFAKGNHGKFKSRDALRRGNGRG